MDQPSPTYTNNFVLKYGRENLDDPLYEEDSTVNMAWASAVIMNAAPPSVRSLDLSIANMDNFNSFATVNRLLSMSHRRPLQSQMSTITRLQLTIRGIAGTHGSEDEHGDTGSAGTVRHWTKALRSLHALRHLELRDAMAIVSGLQFSDSENSDSQANILEWILPNLVLKQLRTLRLSGFTLNTDNVLKTLAGSWPRLEYLILEDICLLKVVEGGLNFELSHIAHLRGTSWVVCAHELSEVHNPARIILIRPSSSINDRADYSIASVSVESLRDLGISVDADYGSVCVENPDTDQLLRNMEQALQIVS